MKFLVTGSEGFIGKNLVLTLVKNYEVVGVDNLCNDGGFGITEHKNYTFVKGDICDEKLMMTLISQVDIVVHLAAYGSVPRSMKYPLLYEDNNIKGTSNMMEAARIKGVKRFVYASSSSVYGDSAKLPKVEGEEGNVLSPYALTKNINEHYGRLYTNVYGLGCIGLRYFNVFGKRQDPDGAYAAVIPNWVASILNKEDVYINGDGKTSRDFCYVDNAVQANILAAMTENSEATDQVYNVALNDRTSLNELFRIIEDSLIKNVKGLEKKEPIYGDFRPGDVRHSQASIDKAKKLLGYEPQFRIAEGLNEAISWYINSLK